jgi:hypothetical protein
MGKIVLGETWCDVHLWTNCCQISTQDIWQLTLQAPSLIHMHQNACI